MTPVTPFSLSSWWLPKKQSRPIFAFIFFALTKICQSVEASKLAAVVSIRSPSAAARRRPSLGFFANFSSMPSVATELVLRKAGDDQHGCSPMEAVPAGHRPIAIVVSRGTCLFVEKALNAQHAGAAALIVVWDSNRISPMQSANASDNAADPSIMTLSVPRVFGDTLLGAIDAASKGQSVTLKVASYVPPLFDLSEPLMLIMATSLVALGAFVATADLLTGSPLTPSEDVVELNRELSIAMCFAGSVSLVVLYKYMKHLVFLMQLAFCAGGGWCAASFGSSALQHGVSYLQKCMLRIPFVGPVSRADCVATMAAMSLVVGWWNFRNSDLGWLFQDVLGGSIVCMMQGALRLPNLKIATLLLSIMFIYDIFWVFISPVIFKKSVMVEVARGGGTGESMPMLLRVPPIIDPLGSERVLGFGDIVLPGLLISYLRRHDLTTTTEFMKGFFLPAVIGYAVGIIVTLIAVAVTHAGQPALLYLIPTTLGTTIVLAARRQELGSLWEGETPAHERQD